MLILSILFLSIAILIIALVIIKMKSCCEQYQCEIDGINKVLLTIQDDVAKLKEPTKKKRIKLNEKES